MLFNFETLTNFINSPPGQFVAGGVLGGIVWKSFKNIGDVLNENANQEIARWLRVKKLESAIVAEEAVNWPDTFAKVFDRVYGERHLTWRCFALSAVTSYVLVVVATLFYNSRPYTRSSALTLGSIVDLINFGFVGNVLPDYLSLLETRYVLRFMKRTDSPLSWLVWLGLDLFLTVCIALCATHLMLSIMWIGNDPRSWEWSIEGVLRHFSDFRQSNSARVFFFPAFFTSVWLWLYGASGAIVRFARRFDTGFDWFNRKFDIEKKPLQSIGLVAASLVSLFYWTTSIILHLI